MAKPQNKQKYLKPRIPQSTRRLQTGLIYSRYRMRCQGVFGIILSLYQVPSSPQRRRGREEDLIQGLRNFKLVA